MDSEFNWHSQGCAGPSTKLLCHTLLIAVANPTTLLCAGKHPSVQAFLVLSRAGIPSELSSVEAFVDVQYSSSCMRCTAVKHVGCNGSCSSRKSVHSRNQCNQYRIVTSIVLLGLVRHRVHLAIVLHLSIHLSHCLQSVLHLQQLSNKQENNFTSELWALGGVVLLDRAVTCEGLHETTSIILHFAYDSSNSSTTSLDNLRSKAAIVSTNPTSKLDYLVLH